MPGHYNYDDLLKAYEAVGVRKGTLAMVRTDLRFLGMYAEKGRDAVLSAHFNALAELVDLNEGTLVVPTASMALCNTDTPFDPAETPSEMGVLTEYVRTRPNAVRSLHPFVSYTAVGRHAQEICGRVSRHAYGPETPEARMIEMGGLDVNVGLHPRFMCSIVHHLEQVMGVPYRYTKEYMHPVSRNGSISIEPFYMCVRYLDCEIVRNKNVRIYKSFADQGHDIAEHALGRGAVYAMSMADFYEAGMKTFSKDIYCWLETPPETRPYVK